MSQQWLHRVLEQGQARPHCAEQLLALLLVAATRALGSDRAMPAARGGSLTLMLGTTSSSS